MQMHGIHTTLACIEKSAVSRSSAHMQLHIWSVHPQPPTDISLSSPFSQLKSCQNMLTQISFSFLPSALFFSPLVPLSLPAYISPLSAN